MKKGFVVVHATIPFIVSPPIISLFLFKTLRNLPKCIMFIFLSLLLP